MRRQTKRVFRSQESGVRIAALLLFLLTSDFCLLTPAYAATKLFLRNTASALGVSAASGSTGYGCNNLTGPQNLLLASTTAGTASASKTHTPTNTAPPCQSADGTNYYVWYSPPLSSGLTLSGNIDFNITCTESATATNAAMRMIVKRWDALYGGPVSTILTSADTLECGAAGCTSNRCAIAAAAPTSTTLNTGDRLMFIVEIRNVGGGWGGNGSRTVTLQIDAASGSAGDTFANFADTISFSADSNNAPAIGMSQ